MFAESPVKILPSVTAQSKREENGVYAVLARKCKVASGGQDSVSQAV